MQTQKLQVCFVTEVDLKQIGGAVTTDTRMIHCLSKVSNVKIIYIQKTRFKSMPLSLLVFLFTILRSLPKHYRIYFSRGLFPSSILLLLRPFGRYRIVHQALSVPFPSREVSFLPHNGLESIIRYHLFRFLEQTALRKVDGITVASSEYGDALADFGVEKKKIWVIPLTVDDTFFQQPIKEEPSEIFTFCYAGRFHLYHVLVPFVQAFDLVIRKGARAQLLLVGEGPVFSQVKKEVGQQNPHNEVKFLGMVSHDVFPSLLSKVDCFVLMSQAPGMPIGILEAAAAGKPILTLKRKSDETLSRYFEHGKEIFMVESSSPEQISEAMLLLYTNSNLRRTIAYGARKVARQHFSEETVVPKLLEIIS
jgi:glycosyltransferase involved in cell wall biosynthesis